MAFPAVSAQQELNNRKILEELQLKKQQLTKSGAPIASTASAGASSSTSSNVQQQQHLQQSQSNPHPQQPHMIQQHPQQNPQHPPPHHFQPQQPPQQPQQQIISGYQQQHSSGHPQQQQHPHQHPLPPATHAQQQSHQNDITFNNNSRAAWLQATNQSACYYLHQDSGYGNTCGVEHPQPPMKLKKLEEYLQGVDSFERPKILLEQYATPSHIAAHMLYAIQSRHGDLTGKLVADLGAGCGMLSIGAFLMGASATVGFELDPDAACTFRQNVTEMELPAVECVQADVLQADGPLAAGGRWTRAFDTVLLNPPFGTKHNAGQDMRFVEVALRLARGAVYSLHKSSTRDYIRKRALQEWGCEVAEVVAELRYNLEASYKFHKKKSVDIEVDCWRFVPKRRSEEEDE